MIKVGHIFKCLTELRPYEAKERETGDLSREEGKSILKYLNKFVVVKTSRGGPDECGGK